MTVLSTISRPRHCGLILLLVSAALNNSAAQPAAPDAFRIGTPTTSSVTVFQGEKPVLVYNHGAITNAQTPAAKPHSAYIHPIYGLDGEIITGDFPADHVYHRGLYWAWPHIKINDKEYDLWSLRGIRIEFERWKERTATAAAAVLALENSWIADGKKVMREEVHVRVHRAAANSRAIDLELSWTPSDRPITLWGAPGKSYGGLTLRFGKRSKTVVTVPGRRAMEDLLMAKLPWADLSGDFAEGAMSGAAVFVHPGHPGYPPEWMTREYGVLAVGWPGVKKQTIEAGRTVKCRYGIWVHRGNPEAAEIQQAYDTFRGNKQ